MTTKVWPASRDCLVCQGGFFPKAIAQIYCSAKCRDRAKYDRIRNDPDKWAAYLAKDREQYVPKVRVTRTCGVDGCEEKHLARGMCRQHYRRARYREGLDRRKQPTLISALVKRYDEAGEFIEPATSRRVAAEVSPTLVFVECPDCGRVMFRIPNAAHDLRDCAACRVRVMLNEEEVEWLTSEARSIERSKPTLN